MERYEMFDSLPTLSENPPLRVGSLPTGNELALDLYRGNIFGIGQDIRQKDGLSPLQQDLADIFDHILQPGWNNSGYEGNETYFVGYYLHPLREKLGDVNHDYFGKPRETKANRRKLTPEQAYIANFDPKFLDGRHVTSSATYLNGDVLNRLLNPHGYYSSYFGARHPEFKARLANKSVEARDTIRHLYQSGVMILHARFDNLEKVKSHLRGYVNDQYDRFKSTIKAAELDLEQYDNMPDMPASPLLTPPRV